MDEPLSNLDAKLRLEMRTELKRLHAETDSTFVYVTHDQLEAMTLATKVCLMSMGHLQQYDPPLVTYNKPNNLFVADFVGNPTMNFVHGSAVISGNTAKVKEREVVVGVRPEFLRVEQGSLIGHVYATLPTGMETTVKLAVGDEILTAVVFGGVDYPFNSSLNYDIIGNGIILFDKESGNRIGIGSLNIAGAKKAAPAKETAEKPAEKKTAAKKPAAKKTTK